MLVKPNYDLEIVTTNAGTLLFNIDDHYYLGKSLRLDIESESKTIEIPCCNIKYIIKR